MLCSVTSTLRAVQCTLIFINVLDHAFSLFSAVFHSLSLVLSLSFSFSTPHANAPDRAHWPTAVANPPLRLTIAIGPRLSLGGLGSAWPAWNRRYRCGHDQKSILCAAGAPRATLRCRPTAGALIGCAEHS